MRFLMKVVMDTDKANQLALAGKLGSTIGGILEAQKPEAAYFVSDQGQRTGFLVVNFDHPSDLPRFAEPWFFAFDAQVHVQPAMIPDDLKKALSQK
jgi:hypothetical protein